MIDYKKLAGEIISNTVPYQPGKPVKEVEREAGVKKAIKLASNENPIGCSKKAIKALEKFLPEVSRYPAGDSYYLREALAKFYKVKMNNILAGAGSDEIIQLLYLAFLKKGEEVISPAPSFSEYYLVARATHGDCRWVNTNEDLTVNFDNLLNAINDKTRFIMLANPNNPTGRSFDEKSFLNFISKVRKDIIVVLDEAYVEYQEKMARLDTIKLVKQHKNIVTLRTFSKAYGLASMRCGYIIADAECIDMMNRVRQPFNLNMAAQVMAEAALADQTHIERVVKLNNDGKKFLYNSCKKLKIKTIETDANFLLVEVGDGKKIFEKLLKEGVIVRYIPHPKLQAYIRVSIGTKDENALFIEKLIKVMKIKK